jgi:hypothetical protein
LTKPYLAVLVGDRDPAFGVRRDSRTKQTEETCNAVREQRAVLEGSILSHKWLPSVETTIFDVGRAAEQIVSRHDTLVLTEALRICGNELKNLCASTTVSAKLERLLLEREPFFPALPLCARLLGMAPRTLHRRLMGDRTSYSEMLDSVRHRLVRECLEAGRQSSGLSAWL